MKKTVHNSIKGSQIFRGNIIFLIFLHLGETAIKSKFPEFVILDNSDFREMFRISAKTARNWRDEGLIEYAQVKGKIYYKLKDVQKFLERHKKK